MNAIVSSTGLLLALAFVGCTDKTTDPGYCPGCTDAADVGDVAEERADTAERLPCNGACGGDTPHCRVSDEMCVGCLIDADCASAAMARCDVGAGTCVGCDDSAQCTRFPGTTVCGGGPCVQCAETEATPCSGNPCNPISHRCSAFATGLDICSLCDTDTNCQLNHHCVPMMFQGNPRHPGERDGPQTQGYCLQLVPGCVSPYRGPPITSRVSLSGATGETYCAVNETRTTCEALADLEDDTPCDDATMMPDPSLCGSEGLADGMCESVNFSADNRCTYACGMDSSECPTSKPCRMGYCGGPP